MAAHESGAEIDANVANFIGIHRMQSLNSPDSEGRKSGPKAEAGDASQSAFMQLETAMMPFSVNVDELKKLYDDDG